jgi:hypothetical protein
MAGCVVIVAWRRAGWRSAGLVGGFSGFLPCCLFGDGVGVEPGLVLLVPDGFPAYWDLGRWWALDGGCEVSCWVLCCA